MVYKRQVNSPIQPDSFRSCSQFSSLFIVPLSQGRPNQSTSCMTLLMRHVWTYWCCLRGSRKSSTQVRIKPLRVCKRKPTPIRVITLQTLATFEARPPLPFCSRPFQREIEFALPLMPSPPPPTRNGREILLSIWRAAQRKLLSSPLPRNVAGHIDLPLSALPLRFCQ